MQGDQTISNLKLILEKQGPSLESAWMEGYAYGEKNLSAELNPFDLRSKAHEYWSEGWQSGFYGDAPLYPEYEMELEPVVQLVASDRGNVPRFERFEKWLYGVGAVVAGMTIVTSMLIDVAA